MEPSWNLTSGPPRTTPEPIWAETPKLSGVGEKKLPLPPLPPPPKQKKETRPARFPRNRSVHPNRSLSTKAFPWAQVDAVPRDVTPTVEPPHQRIGRAMLHEPWRPPGDPLFVPLWLLFFFWVGGGSCFCFFWRGGPGSICCIYDFICWGGGGLAGLEGPGKTWTRKKKTSKWVVAAQGGECIPFSLGVVWGFRSPKRAPIWLWVKNMYHTHLLGRQIWKGMVSAKKGPVVTRANRVYQGRGGEDAPGRRHKGEMGAVHVYQLTLTWMCNPLSKYSHGEKNRPQLPYRVKPAD